MLKIVYHPAYLEYKFGPDHPFWPERAESFLEELKKSNFRHEIVEPQKGQDKDILLVHTQEYLKRVKALAQENGFLSADTPVNLKVLKAAYYSVGGSILACDLALKGNLAVNLLGGLHHAGISNSSGFCLFNDHSIAIKKLQQKKKIKKAMILDLDVHAGQGTQEIFYSDPKVLTVSLHQNPRTLYPGTGFSWQRGKGKGKGFNFNLLLPPGAGETEYLHTLEQVLPLYQKFIPDLLVVVFGADTYRNDPLADLNLEIKTYQKIGQKLASKRPLAIMCAGGYSREVPQIWLSFLRGLVSEDG